MYDRGGWYSGCLGITHGVKGDWGERLLSRASQIKSGYTRFLQDNNAQLNWTLHASNIPMRRQQSPRFVTMIHTHFTRTRPNSQIHQCPTHMQALKCLEKRGGEERLIAQPT
jgi:hypothetical protein